MKKFNRKTLKAGSFALVITLIAAAVVVALNLFVSALPSNVTSVDTSKDKLFTIGDETKALLSATDDEIEIFMFVEEGHENSTTNEISELIKQYVGASNNIKFRVIDPAVSPNFSKKYTDEALTSGSVIVASGDRSRVIKGDSWYMFETAQGRLTASEYQYYSSVYYSYGQTFDAVEIFLGETNLTSAISFVTSDVESKIYYLTGHGETALSGVFSETVSDMNIELTELSLLSGDGKIPDDCTLLIINFPSKDITSGEADEIAAFYENGGAVWLTTYVDYFGGGAEPHLSSLAERLGMKSVDGMILEGDPAHYQSYQYNVIPSLSSSVPEELWTDSALTYVASYAHGIESAGGEGFFPILTTSSLSYLKNNIEEMTTLEREDGDAEGPFTVAAAVTNGDSKFVWYTTPTLTDPRYDYGGNSELFASIVKWTCEGEAVTTVAPKTVSTGYLVASEAGRNTTMFVLTLLVPLAVLGAGFAVWFVRRRRR